MALATNLLLIILSINLMFFLFGNPANCSPILAFVSAWLTGADPVSIIVSFGNALGIYLVLIGIIASAAVLTGGVTLGAAGITTGGGYGAILSLRVLGIAIFSALALFPNFSTLGFPTLASSGIPVLETIYIVFGGLLTVSVVELLQ